MKGADGAEDWSLMGWQYRYFAVICSIPFPSSSVSPSLYGVLRTQYCEDNQLLQPHLLRSYAACFPLRTVPN